MSNQGFLGQSKPAGATNTLLYSAPANRSASTVLNVANDGTGSAYSVGVKRYDQELTVDASTYLLHEGDLVTGYTVTVDTPFEPISAGFSSGLQLTSVDAEKKFKFESSIRPEFVEYFVKSISIRQVALESVTGDAFSIGDTITKGTAPADTTAVIYGINGNTIYIGPSTFSTGVEFAEGDTISTAGGSGGTISTGGLFAAANKFVFSTTVSGIYDLYLTAAGNNLSLFNDRPYRFDVSDSSMTGHLFQLSTTTNGEWGPDGLSPSDPSDTGDGGTENTAGKTTSGTAGSSSAYVQYDFTLDTSGNSLFYWYNGDLTTASNNTYGSESGYLTNTATPTFTQFFVYDVEGTWVNATDAFLVGGTTYTVTAQDAGPYGYVRSYSGTTLQVIKGLYSADFAGTDTFLDAPLNSTADRSTVTVSSVDVATTALQAGEYIIEGKTNAANAVDRTTSLVIGPGERVIVNSATGDNTFSLIGFEDISTALTTRRFGV
ncbi:tail fiber protein [Synechococcus phage S-CAM8]|uniref:Tail fiber protein n=1 Tax=Synechococcus phage S-CAM8 TaxID=754038 RepID=A0A1D8KMY4_9CAUD|nr:tail fiber protein [Synechococcus phage S-CAM8]